MLALLVSLSIALLTVYFGESASGGLHAIQRGFLEVMAPLQEGASRALKPARDLVGWTGDVFDAKSENKDLQQAERGAAARSSPRRRPPSATRGSCARWSGLNRSAGFPAGYDPVGARVIGRSPTVWYSAITIDKGSDQGVHVDQPVVSGAGLVGRVSDVAAGRGARHADHRPHERRVGADRAGRPERAREGDRRQPERPDPRLRAEGARRCRKGATVVTSGWRSSQLESLFPRGIPIGRVSRGSTPTSASSTSACTCGRSRTCASSTWSRS